MRIINCLTENCLEICQSPFGNYVIQFILEEWGIKDCLSIVNIIIKNICMLSIQKFSSNVSEKILSLMNIYTLVKILYLLLIYLKIAICKLL